MIRRCIHQGLAELGQGAVDLGEQQEAAEASTLVEAGVATYAEEATKMVRPFLCPKHEWPVYGVNNKEGVFFSHKQPGAEFNAPYKHIQRDWFFHNPTRSSVARLSVAAKELIRAYPAKVASLALAQGFAQEITAALLDLCTHLHADFPDFCAADYFLELSAHVWMRAGDGAPHDERLAISRDYLRDMARWMGTDGLRGLRTGKPLGKQLIEIYDAVRSRVPKKVFLARWYPPDENAKQKRRADNRVAVLRALVEGDLGLELVDMGTIEGGTYLIHPRMYEAVNSSEIFIADLTGLRPNVMIELGFALHHQPTQRLLLLFNPIAGAEHVPFDTNAFRYQQIGEAQDIPGLLRGHLEAILRGAAEGRL